MRHIIPLAVNTAGALLATAMAAGLVARSFSVEVEVEPKPKPIRRTNTTHVNEMLEAISKCKSYDFMLQTLSKDLAKGYFIGDYFSFDMLHDIVLAMPKLNLSITIDSNSNTVSYKSNGISIKPLKAVEVYSCILNHYITPAE